MTRSESAIDSGPGYVATLLVMGIGGLAVLAAIFYVAFIAIDTGDGLFSKNVSAGMAPALLNGDFITSRRLQTTGSGDLEVHRGDIVVHTSPADPSKQFVKRLVGLPGDTLAMVDGRLLVNGRALAEPYAHREEPTVDPVQDEFNWQRRYLVRKPANDTSSYIPSRNNWGPLVVPPDQYFVLGDNRDQSLDSRYWGFVARNQLQARVRRIYFSRDSTGRIRWSRFGERVR